MRKKSVFINCMETLTANIKHSEARALLNAGLKESAEKQTAATAPAYELTKPYIFPTVDGNMTYHTSWGSHGVKNEAETILSVLNSFRLRSTLEMCIRDRISTGLSISHILRYVKIL